MVLIRRPSWEQLDSLVQAVSWFIINLDFYCLHGEPRHDLSLIGDKRLFMRPNLAKWDLLGQLWPQIRKVEKVMDQVCRSCRRGEGIEKDVTGWPANVLHDLRSIRENYDDIIGQLGLTWIRAETDWDSQDFRDRLLASASSLTARYIAQDDVDTMRLALANLKMTLGARPRLSAFEQGLEKLQLPKLSRLEERILRQLGPERRLTRVQLATEMYREPDSGSFRETLANMVNRGILGNDAPHSPGYYIRPEMRHILDCLSEED